MKISSLPIIDIPFSKRKSLAVLGIAITGIVIAFYFLSPGFELQMIRNFMFLFFGIPVLIIVTVVKILMQKPIVSLSPGALWWKGTLGNDDCWLPWTEIQRFEYNDGPFFNRVIFVFVNHPENYLSKKLSKRSSQEKKNKNIGTHLMIPVSFLDKSPEELMSLLQNYKDVANGKPGSIFIPHLSN